MSWAQRCLGPPAGRWLFPSHRYFSAAAEQLQSRLMPRGSCFLCLHDLEKYINENGNSEAVPAGFGGSSDSTSPRRRTRGAFLVTRRLCGTDGRTRGGCWPRSCAEPSWGSCWMLGAPCGIQKPGSRIRSCWGGRRGMLGEEGGQDSRAVPCGGRQGEVRIHHC